MSGRVPVTVVVLTFNEESTLTACLESVAWADTVIVVDSGSTDRTVHIAHDFGAQVVTHPFENYGAQRNWALTNLEIRTPWILNVDADERISPELSRSIERALTRDDGAIAGYRVSRRTMFLGRWIRHGGHYPAWHLRLFRTGRGRCENTRYDQHFLVDGPVDSLDGDLVDTLTTDVATYVRRHVRWAELEAEGETPAVDRMSGALSSSDPMRRRRWLRERYGRLPLFARPFIYFFYRYVVRLGFLDGTPGLVFHVLQGFWFRFMVDSLIYERSLAKSNAAPPRDR
jgi:glycosyltransferase involved in cell wall biosynthesis